MRADNRFSSHARPPQRRLPEAGAAEPRAVTGAPGRPGPRAAAWPDPLRAAGDEAVLPAGSTLASEARPGGKCFVLLEGRAVAEREGQQVAVLRAGSFVGAADEAGQPRPPSGLTVRLVTPARVLVLDAARLAALVEQDPAAAAAWHQRPLWPASIS